MTIDTTDLLTLLGIAVAAVLGYLGSKITARESRKATESGSAADMYGTLSERLLARLEDVESRVDHLERELRASQRLLRMSYAFAERLLTYLRTHLPDRTDVPSIPEELREHINNEDSNLIP